MKTKQRKDDLDPKKRKKKKAHFPPPLPSPKISKKTSPPQCSLTDVTSMIVSHDSGFLDNVCTHIIHYENRKLRRYKGNLSEFVKQVREELFSSFLPLFFSLSFFVVGCSSLLSSIFSPPTPRSIYSPTNAKQLPKKHLKKFLSTRRPAPTTSSRRRRSSSSSRSPRSSRASSPRTAPSSSSAT